MNCGYLTCRVVGYDADNLFVEHPWSLRILRIPVADFPGPWLQSDDPRLRLVSDFHAGDPESVKRATGSLHKAEVFPDLFPQQNTEEAPGMNLYSVILIDTYNKIVIDTKIVAKNDEAAKLAAGVYRWLLENGRTFDDVTVCVGHLCRVRERMTGSGA